MISLVRCFFVVLSLGVGGSIAVPSVVSQDAFGRLGILLDTDPEMEGIVPQVRKEVRFLNAALESEGREPVVLMEFSGAALEAEGGFSVPGTKNVWYAFKRLFEENEVDGVYWITRLKGLQSGRGLYALGELLEEQLEGRPEGVPLTIRNIWQEQVQEGVSWILDPPGPEIDPLGDPKFPSEWFDVLSAGQGYLVRSWMIAPTDFVSQFGYFPRINSPYVLKKLNIDQRSASMDTRWATKLDRQFGLRFVRENETWADSLTGREWLNDVTVTPFLTEESLADRSESVIAELCKRDSIERDLERIEAENIGVLFGIGYLEKDLARFKSMAEGKRRDSRMRYIADLGELVREVRQHIAVHEAEAGRVYQSEYIELQGTSVKVAEEDRYAFAMARLVREEKVDAIYLYTNGYTGGREYGRFGVNVPLMAEAIREAGVKLYVRVPFEMGAAPMDLQRLAIASRGGVFIGKEGDEDWSVELPEGEWPEVGEFNE